MTNSVSEIRIIRVNNAGNGSENIIHTEIHVQDSEVDLVAIEEPLEIRLRYGSFEARNTKSISITMRTPGNDFELATGFLFTEGIIKKKEDISQIAYVNSLLNPENILIIELNENVKLDLIKLERHFYTTSSCGVCGKASIEAVKTTGDFHKSNNSDNLKIKKDIIYKLPYLLRQKQDVFESTGGLHASAIFDMDGNLLMTCEDVGRHNALDKIIGLAMSGQMLPLNNHILLLSGRTSFELIQKAAMAQIKIVAAVGAPSSLAVQMAKDFNMTLIGFLKSNRFNIYAGEERIIH